MLTSNIGNKSGQNTVDDIYQNLPVEISLKRDIHIDLKYWKQKRIEHS